MKKIDRLRLSELSNKDNKTSKELSEWYSLITSIDLHKEMDEATLRETLYVKFYNLFNASSLGKPIEEKKDIPESSIRLIRYMSTRELLFTIICHEYDTKKRSSYGGIADKLGITKSQVQRAAERLKHEVPEWDEPVNLGEWEIRPILSVSVADTDKPTANK